MKTPAIIAKDAITIIKDTFSILKENGPLQMAGATAFFTTFALPPIIMIIVRALGLFFNRRTIGRELIEKLSTIIGPEGSEQVRATIKSVLALQNNWLITIGIFLFLLFVATTLFKVIKASLNQIWNIRINTDRSISLRIRTRLRAVAMILATGLLFLAVLIVDAIQALLGQYLSSFSPNIAIYINGMLNFAVSIIITSLWFLMLFYFLPDGRPRLRIAAYGAVLTGILFSIGKMILRSLLGASNIGQLYGTAGALVLVLLFVFYSSLIFYSGASFIRAFSNFNGEHIQPRHYATRYRITATNIQDQ